MRTSPIGADRERADIWSELAEAVAGPGAAPASETARHTSWRAEGILADALGRLRRATGAVGAVIWLDIAGQVRAELVDPPGMSLRAQTQLPSESDTCAAIWYGGDRLGAIEVIDPKLGAGATRWVREVATAAASILHNVVVREVLRHHVALAMAQRDQLRIARSDLVARQNAERRRVASDIHDGCQQRVTVIAGKIGLIGSLLDRPDPGSRAEAALMRAELDGDIEDLVEALNAIISGQAPPRLDRSGLVAALRREVGGLPLEVQVTGVPGPLPRSIEESVYFCCLEAVQNAARHSGGRAVQVSLRREPGALVFTVTDDGKGFDTTQAGHGAGLANLRRRVEQHGGRLSLVACDMGTHLTGTVPLPRGTDD